MWQRIQTLYLALSTALIALLFFTFKATGPAGDISFVSYWPYLVLLILITGLNILALTSWKFRVFQARTAVLAAIFTLALQAWLAVDFAATHGEYVFHIFAVLPVIAVILDFLAAKKIWADELMVRNSDRLRAPRKKR